jgi:hypothetical protein
MAASIATRNSVMVLPARTAKAAAEAGATSDRGSQVGFPAECVIPPVLDGVGALVCPSLASVGVAVAELVPSAHHGARASASLCEGNDDLPVVLPVVYMSCDARSCSQLSMLVADALPDLVTPRHDPWCDISAPAALIRCGHSPDMHRHGRLSVLSTTPSFCRTCGGVFPPLCVEGSAAMRRGSHDEVVDARAQKAPRVESV